MDVAPATQKGLMLAERLSSQEKVQKEFSSHLWLVSVSSTEPALHPPFPCPPPNSPPRPPTCLPSVADERTPEQLVIPACLGSQTRGCAVAVRQGEEGGSLGGFGGGTAAVVVVAVAVQQHGRLYHGRRNTTPRKLLRNAATVQQSTTASLCISLPSSLHPHTPPAPTPSQTGSDAAICNGCKAGTYRREHESII